MVAFAGDQLRYLPSSVGLHTRDDMCVLLESESGAFVTKAFTDDLWLDACLQRDGGVGVPQIVEPNSWHVDLGDESLEHLREGLRMERLAVLLAEHQIIVLVVGPPGLAFH